MDKLELFAEVTRTVTALVEARKVYGSFVDIVHDKTYSQEERYEASELTKDGFHSFVGKIQKMAKE